jgi:hypothetical protein
MDKIRTGAIAVTAVAAMGVGALATTAASARPSATYKVTDGKSSVKLSAKSRKAMKQHHLHLTPIAPSTLKHGKLSSPVTGGTFTGISADIKSGGGFKISKGGTTITVTKLDSQSNAGGGSGTAKVSGQGRIEVITVSQPQNYDFGKAGGKPAKFSGFTVTMSPNFVKVLDQAFHTKQFKKHATIGTGSTTFHYK